MDININVKVTFDATPALLEAIKGEDPMADLHAFLAAGRAAEQRKERTVKEVTPRTDGPETGEGPIGGEPAPKKKQAPMKAVPPAPPEETELTMAQVQEVARKKAMGGKKAKIKDLLTKHGAEKITDIGLSDLAEFYAELSAL